MRHRIAKRGVVISLFAVLGLVFAVLPASADGGPAVVPSEATVTNTGGGGGGGAAGGPFVECKWELPDMHPAAPGDGPHDGTAWDDIINTPGEAISALAQLDDIQYEHPLFEGVHDDDPVTSPPVAPCALGGAFPEFDEAVAYSMIQVSALPENLPELRRIQNWAAVSHPDGTTEIADVYWKIFHPDGTPKIQIHGMQLLSPDFVGAADCDTLGLDEYGTSPADLVDDSMWEAAYGTGQVEFEVIQSWVPRCLQNKVEFFYSEWVLDKHQPCNDRRDPLVLADGHLHAGYKVEVTAVDADGNSDTVQNYIDVLCYPYLLLDFESVNYGTVQPGGYKDIAGDFDFDRPVAGNVAGNDPGQVAPSIKNGGPGGMITGIQFDDLIQVGVPLPKKIDKFDAAIGTSHAVAEFINIFYGAGYDLPPQFVFPGLDPQGHLPSNVAVFFPNKHGTTLCANEVGKLHFSVHPGTGIEGGVYAGDVTLFAAPDVAVDRVQFPFFEDDYTCNNDKGIWDASSWGHDQRTDIRANDGWTGRVWHEDYNGGDPLTDWTEHLIPAI